MWALSLFHIPLLKDKQLRVIREFIKENYKEMYLKWLQMSDQGFYGE